MDSSPIEWFEFDDDDQSTDESSVHPFEPEEFSDLIMAQISPELKAMFSEVAQLWERIGFPNSYREERAEQMHEMLIDQAKQIVVQKEKEFMQKCQEFADIRLKEINQMRADLVLPPMSMPHKRNLISLNKFLQTEYKKLVELKQERLEILSKIENKLKKICQQLGIAYQPTKFATNIPSEMELKSLSQILNNHEKTLLERMRQYDLFISNIRNLQSELEYRLETESEKALLDIPKEEFIFSTTNLALLSDLNKKLARLFTDAKSEVERLKNRLAQLYNWMDVKPELRDEFADKLVGPLPGQKLMLEEEIGKYELIKKNSIGRIIQNIRTGLSAMFDRCMVLKFPEHLMNQNEMSEELLLELEQEAEKLQRFDSCYRSILDMLREWEDSLAKLIELEKKSTDPTRFTNRGGSLLQMERDRKLLSKKLPKMEKDIRTTVADLEAENQLPFDSYGLDLDHFFQSNWRHISDLRNKNKSKSSNDSGSCQKSSVKKMRVPLSPRGGGNQAVYRNLENEMEQHFRMDLMNNKKVMHSTQLDADDLMSHLDLHTPELGRTPRMQQHRRRSRSCDPRPPQQGTGGGGISSSNGTRPLKLNRMNELPTGVTQRFETVARRRPFLP